MTRRSVLVIDDEPQILRLMERVLRKDYDVLTAGNAIDGYALMCQQKPDLVLLDVMMVQSRPGDNARDRGDRSRSRSGGARSGTAWRHEYPPQARVTQPACEGCSRSVGCISSGTNVTRRLQIRWHVRLDEAVDENRRSVTNVRSRFDGGRDGFVHVVSEREGRLSGSVIARSRGGARNREQPVTFRATEIIDIVRHPDASGAEGFAEGTRGWWHQEKMDALLDGGLSHLLPHRSHRPD